MSSVTLFVSYRREDVPDATYRLVDALSDRFGQDDIFLDVDKIEPGARFAEVIEKWVGRCDVLLAVIGDGWLESRDDTGARRLESAEDFVRLEIEAALARDIRVVPVLIHNAPIPKANELPESMAQLLDRNAIQLSRNHWDVDVARLAAAIERIAGERAAAAFMQSGDRSRLSPGLPPAASLPPAGATPQARIRYPEERQDEPRAPVGGSSRPGHAPAAGRLLWRAVGLTVLAAVAGAAIAVLASSGSKTRSPQTVTRVAVTETRSGAVSSATQPTGATQPTIAGSATSAPAGTEPNPTVHTSSAAVTNQVASSPVATTASTVSQPGRSASGVAPRSLTTDPQAVVSRYWQDIAAHRFSAAYKDLVPSSIGESELQFVANERAAGIKSARFAGKTEFVSGSSSSVAITSLVTRDSRRGCAQWTGSYKMKELSGRWLIARAEIQPQRCQS